eukprot:CAMPEP_0195288428 /NCGR_PEP_ID=MMETSP0707-20130614/5099_1 /TAXON_ID=33640 /ORGANISM="Asterionellopsis glacialis, Strain CCMP134" /LENGTH=154 /DNA_ID=CAMNT_0040348295 /DNA_START=228 /DNA_END=692 /DNA_ORIENTATION=-
MNDKDEPLVAKSSPLENEAGYCTKKLQSFISEPPNNQVEMHMLSWEVIMMSTATTSCNDNDVQLTPAPNRKRKDRATPDKFANLCALGGDKDRPELRRCKPKHHHDFEKQKIEAKGECSLYRNNQSPSFDWGHFITSPFPEVHTSNYEEFSVET